MARKKERVTHLVRVEDSVLRDLRKYGQFGQSYSDVIKSLISSYKLALKMRVKKDDLGETKTKGTRAG